MSASQSGPHSASFGATAIYGPAGFQQDIDFMFTIRPRTTSALGTALVTFSWVDENGTACTHIAPLVSLANLNNLQSGSFLMRLGFGQSISVAATLVLGGTFDILYFRDIH